MAKKRKKPSKGVIIKMIDSLFKRAESRDNLKKAKVDVRKARRLGMKNRIPLTKYKRRMCKHCHTLLIPGRNCRVRLHKSRIIYKCLECNKFTRFVVKK